MKKPYLVASALLIALGSAPVILKTNYTTAANTTDNRTTLTLTGTIKKVERISADIPYDYVISVAEPLHGWDSKGDGSGIQEILIWSEAAEQKGVTPEIVNQIKSLENQKVELEGIIEWGYAEHSHLLVQRIKRL